MRDTALSLLQVSSRLEHSLSILACCSELNKPLENIELSTSKATSQNLTSPNGKIPLLVEALLASSTTVVQPSSGSGSKSTPSWARSWVSCLSWFPHTAPTLWFKSLRTPTTMLSRITATQIERPQTLQNKKATFQNSWKTPASTFLTLT